MGFVLYVRTEDVLRPGGLFLVYYVFLYASVVLCYQTLQTLHSCSRNITAMKMDDFLLEDEIAKELAAIDDKDDDTGLESIEDTSSEQSDIIHYSTEVYTFIYYFYTCICCFFLQ